MDEIKVNSIEADIYQMALDVFASEKDAFNWLRLPHSLLDVHEILWCRLSGLLV